MARIKTFNKEEILDKALNLFWTKGFNATSASDLVSHLGLSRSSLYDTFGDKRSLFLLCLAQYQKKVSGEMISLIQNSEDIRNTIAIIFELIIEQDLMEKVPKGCFLVNTTIELAPIDREIANIIIQNQKEVESALELALEKGKAKGQIAPSYNPDALAKFFFNAFSGLRVAIRSHKDTNALKEIIKVSLSVLDY